MQETIKELEKILTDYAPKLSAMSEEDILVKPLTGTWTKSEILGHMIDSVQNNIRRFIVRQYEDNPHIVYAQDFWVAAAGYKDYPFSDLVSLWVLMNKHACRVLKNIPTGDEQRTCNTGETRTIAWLASDYNKHLLHHLHQLLDLEPIAYP
jgi:hypothetical protein